MQHKVHHLDVIYLQLLISHSFVSIRPSEGQSLGQVDATNVHLYGVKSVTSSNGEECVVLKMYVSSEQTGVLALSSLTSAVQVKGAILLECFI